MLEDEGLRKEDIGLLKTPMRKISLAFLATGSDTTAFATNLIGGEARDPSNIRFFSSSLVDNFGDWFSGSVKSESKVASNSGGVACHDLQKRSFFTRFHADDAKSSDLVDSAVLYGEQSASPHPNATTARTDSGLFKNLKVVCDSRLAPPLPPPYRSLAAIKTLTPQR